MSANSEPSTSGIEMNIFTAKAKEYKESKIRKRIVSNIFETEKNYVDALRILFKEYLQPIYKTDYVEVFKSRKCDGIHEQIAIITNHHEIFLGFLMLRLDLWDINQGIADLFYNLLKGDLYYESFSNFVINWKCYRMTLKDTYKGLDGPLTIVKISAKKNRNDISLNSLLLKPIQQMMYYSVYISSLKKYTNQNYYDYAGLLNVESSLNEYLTEFDKNAPNIEELIIGPNEGISDEEEELEDISEELIEHYVQEVSQQHDDDDEDDGDDGDDGENIDENAGDDEDNSDSDPDECCLKYLCRWCRSMLCFFSNKQ